MAGGLGEMQDDAMRYGDAEENEEERKCWWVLSVAETAVVRLTVSE